MTIRLNFVRYYPITAQESLPLAHLYLAVRGPNKPVTAAHTPNTWLASQTTQPGQTNYTPVIIKLA